MTSGGPADEVREPTSPELVLVSPPEIARQARERLADPSSVPETRARSASVAAPPATPPAATPAAAPGIARARRPVRTWALSALVAGSVLALALVAFFTFVRNGSDRISMPEWRTLSGSGNNRAHPRWGQLGTQYLRVAKPTYANRIGRMVSGPDARYISNRIFNDRGQNIFSEGRVSQWGWVWGQFLDHTFGLRDERRGASAPIGFDRGDPLESFRNDLGMIDFARTPRSPGTGVSKPRQQINTVSSYIDAFSVYGGTSARLEWLRRGPVDGKMSNNRASLLLPGGYLPRTGARGDVATSPPMDLMGALVGRRTNAVVAGDVRANENIALTSVHTLFAREHNRIVRLLPATLTEEEKFQIARRVVGAEQQYVTYQEFLPALGVRLPPYRGYDPTVNASISNEFAVAGYRVHSMVHGEFELSAAPGTRPGQLSAFRSGGMEVDQEGKEIKLAIPLGLAYGNPALLQSVGIGPFLSGLGDERQYRNDEQIDDTMRSILFQIPKPGARNLSKCGAPVVQPRCFTLVQDLGAIDVQRGRDHGLPYYNQMRVAYGLAPKRSYAAITGEGRARFPHVRSLVGVRDPIDDPDILDFTRLEDAEGKLVKPKSDEASEGVVTATRRTTLASRLKAIYGDGNVNRVDAFVGMLSEPHLHGTEFGELQLAIWKRQFQALRDGDRFFYENDPFLDQVRRHYGIDYRQTLAEIIKLNTGSTVRTNLFKAPIE